MADKNIVKRQKLLRRKSRIHKKVLGTPEKPRLAVFRSLKHIYIQFIDDLAENTLASVSTRSPQALEKLKGAKSKVDAGFILGQLAGEIARGKGISKVVFDRSGYLFAGRVKAVAEGARKAGLKF